MAKLRKNKNQGGALERIEDVAMRAHLQAIGIHTVCEYQAWCSAHGFGSSLHKSETQRRLEQETAKQARAEATLAQARRFERRPTEVLERLASGQAVPDDVRSPHLREMQAAFATTRDLNIHDALRSLLLLAHKHSNLLATEPVIPYLGRRQDNTFIRGLLALARHHKGWLRAPEDWKPDSHNAHRQFGSLARFLLARYEVPAFMDAAWFEGEQPNANRHQAWFRHIGEGNNIRTAEVPIALTKKAAHAFAFAPRDLPIEAALRRGQALGLGGDEALARALAGTRLSQVQADEPFWETVVHWFVNNPMIDPARIGPLVDYIHHQKFVAAEVIAPDGKVIGFAVAEPEFTMKGRSALALLRRMETWHHRLSREVKRPPQEWMASGIEGLRVVRQEQATAITTVWSVEELLSSRALQEEGAAMQHCVASYVPSCVGGRCSIWSVRFADHPKEAGARILTIEVDNARRMICQVRGKCNRAWDKTVADTRLNAAPDIVRRWAEQERLLVPAWL